MTHTLIQEIGVSLFSVAPVAWEDSVCVCRLPVSVLAVSVIV